jgi:SAM-dependent methyltransferase
MTDTESCRHEPGAPSAWLLGHAMLLPAGGRVLDLACGSGRNARWLARQGFRVVAVDRDAAAITGLGAEGIDARCLDLETEDWPLAGEVFDGIVVTRYLHRPRLADLLALLVPGGVLIYETFMRGNEAYGSPRRPEFLLESGELAALALAHGLETLAFREGFEPGPPPAITQSICCRQA